MSIKVIRKVEEDWTNQYEYYIDQITQNLLNSTPSPSSSLEAQYVDSPTINDTHPTPVSVEITLPGNLLNIVKVEVSYNFVAEGSCWMSEQRSYIWCKNTGGIKESKLNNGVGDSKGTMSYNRNITSLIANVLSPTSLIFELHPFKDYDGSSNYIEANSLVFTIYHTTSENPEIIEKLIISNWVGSEQPTIPSFVEGKQAYVNSSTTFQNKQTLTQVIVNDHTVKFIDNDMSNVFNNCRSLTDVNFIPVGVTNMAWTFFNCYNLVDAPTIPNSVMNMSNTFSGCNNLVNAPTIPNSVVNMANTFYFCNNLVNAPIIGNSVVDMYGTFSRCNNLVNAPTIPNSVVDMPWTFSSCNNLINAPTIGNSVVNMYETFYYCYNLVNAPTIPNSVVNMFRTFCNCTNINSSPIIPNSVGDMNGTFWGCSNLVNAPTIPNSVVNMSYTFYRCYNLINAPTIPNSVVSMSRTFDSCYNLVNAPTIPNSVVDMSSTFNACINLVNAPTIPNSVVNMSSTFINCYNLVNAPTIPNIVTNMMQTFRNCTNLTGDITILSPSISNFANCFNGTSLPKTVYVPAGSTTFTTLNTIYGTGINGVTIDEV